MSVSTSAAKTSAAIVQNSASDVSTAKSLGKAFDAAEHNYQKALKTKDQSKIGAAQIEFNKAQENFMGFLSAKNRAHELIMQLISMLSR